jgi:hypothetical protein
LCKNAKVFDNTLMVGVVECTDTCVINQTRQSVLRPAPIERAPKRSIDEILVEEDSYFAQRKRLKQDDELVRPERGIWARILDNVLSF